MTIDDRIQRLMQLLAEVKLRASHSNGEGGEAGDGEKQATEIENELRKAREEATAAPSFDPETTVVDDEASRKATANGPPISVIGAVPPLPEPPESLSRLIAAPRSGLDYDADGDTKTGLDDDDEADAGDREELSRELRIPAATIETRAYEPMESGPELEVLSDLDLDVRAPGEAIGDLDDTDGGSDIGDLGSGSLRAEERIERSPASSRRPVLPDDVAPALPDLEWDDTSTSDAPPESGNHVASSGQMRASVPVPSHSSVAPASSSTGTRDPSANVPASSVSPSTPPVATFVGTLITPTPATFGDLLDATLAL